MTERESIGVLLMAYGGPESVADIPGYLADIRSGRTTPAHVLEEITRNYRAIGGRSPLLEHTKRQGDGLLKALGGEASGFRLYLGMRHWAPWIEETVGLMARDGIRRAVTLVLAPQYSALSTAKYQQRITEGLSLSRCSIDLAHIDSYHDAPGLVEAFSRRVASGFNAFEESDREDVHVVFTAHSLPERVLATGDPYDRQARETAALVAARSGLEASRWSWAYQSAGRSAERWLGPSLRDHLVALHNDGVRKIVIVPVGFVSEHVEILYDIDIDAKELALSLGMRLERPSALNDDPLFTSELARLVRNRAEAAGWT